MSRGILYKNCDNLEVLESLPEKSYDLIYLDVPYFSNHDSFTFMYKADDEVSSIRKYLAEHKGCKIGDIALDDVAAEREKQDKRDVQKYSGFISHIIENTSRLLTEDGILCFLSPSKEYVDINYRLILDQFYSSSMNVTLERPVHPHLGQRANNDILCFYSKKQKYEFPVLLELAPIEQFSFKDDFDYYNKVSLLANIDRKNLQFEWYDLLPLGSTSWRYPKDKLDQLLSENRIEISNGHAFLKCYRREHPAIVSSVWQYKDKFHFGDIAIDSQSIERMFKMFISDNKHVLCPFDYGGKFSLLANECGYNWTSIYYQVYPEGKDLLSHIPVEDYIIREVNTIYNRINYSENIITSQSDIVELRKKVASLSESIKIIQNSIGLDERDEISIDTVVEKIHNQVTSLLSAYSIEGCIPESQKWINPYWERLESESKHFLPTGILLYNQFANDPNIDMAPIMIEFCKTLEKELFQKMFYGYIKNIIERGIDISTEFRDSLNNTDTSVFAKFLIDCTNKYQYVPTEWKFEIGKMAYILQQALAKNPKDLLILDFRNYLDCSFEQQFFREKFDDQLSVVTKLRNSCAHPSIIDRSKVDNGKEIIRRKLLSILKYYK